MFQAAGLWGSLLFSRRSTWGTNPEHLQEERHQRAEDTVHVVRGVSQVSEKKRSENSNGAGSVSFPLFPSPFLCIHFPCLSVPRFSFSVFKRGLRSLGFSPKFPGKDSSQPVPIRCSGWDYEVPQLCSSLVPEMLTSGPHSACQAGTLSRARGRGTG